MHKLGRTKRCAEHPFKTQKLHEKVRSNRLGESAMHTRPSGQATLHQLFIAPARRRTRAPGGKRSCKDASARPRRLARHARSDCATSPSASQPLCCSYLQAMSGLSALQRAAGGLVSDIKSKAQDARSAFRDVAHQVADAAGMGDSRGEDEDLPELRCRAPCPCRSRALRTHLWPNHATFWPLTRSLPGACAQGAHATRRLPPSAV